jgi:(4S)-4-hydroxy-5-phosphonooxypentane-2,3-dione isomerase
MIVFGSGRAIICAQRARWGQKATLAYKFYRLGEPGMFAVYESFVDETGDQAHGAYAHNKPLIEQMIACMDGMYERELLFDLEPLSESN